MGADNDIVVRLEPLNDKHSVLMVYSLSGLDPLDLRTQSRSVEVQILVRIFTQLSYISRNKFCACILRFYQLFDGLVV